MVVEELKEKRLNSFGINIRTLFQDGEAVKERNTNHTKDDNIENGIILEKEYYKDNKFLYKEKFFDSRMTFSYEFDHNGEMSCKNCGKTGTMDDFVNGCPYCHTAFNMEYQKKELGSKHYYDLTIKSKKYIITTLCIDLVVTFFIVLFYLLTTSRTFYFFDMMKVVAGTLLIGLLLFYVFYYLDAFFILPSIRKKKEAINEQQKEFWKELDATEDDKTRLFNNIHYALRQYYYSDREKNVIDFDIMDFNSFKINNKNPLTITANIEIRIVKYEKGTIHSEKMDQDYCFVKADKHEELKGGANIIDCPNCGASINVNDTECSYCGTSINRYQEWFLQEKER